jgi:hypothetical protein
MYWRELWKTEIATAACLVAVPASAVAFATILSGGRETEAGLIWAYFFVIFGAGPALLLFAPVYAWLRYRKTANIVTAIACGGIAASVLGFMHLAQTAIPAGCVVALATHLIMKLTTHVATKLSSTALKWAR